MKIRWNGHSSFTIFADNGTSIVTDPYEPGAFGGGIGYLPIDVDPDVVTISHNHADHNYTQGFSGKFKEIRGDGQAKGIAFTGVTTYHDGNKGADRGTNTVICFTVDNIRVCHLGDLGHTLSDEQIQALGKVDVLMMPIGGFYTIDANQATDIMERVRPKIVLPMHFKTDKCGFPIAEVSAFTGGKERVKNIGTDEIELAADRLPGETEILVLKHRL